MPPSPPFQNGFFDAPGPQTEARETVLSVSALNRSVRDLIEHRLPLMWVEGEVSNLTLARSGHYYFSLKDDQAQVRCVMFRHRAQAIAWQPREGMHVVARALPSLYEARGEFQLNVEFMRQGGQGALYEAFVRLRDRLAREGLFDAALKRPLPAYPRALGIVTSLQAAALRDVLTTLARRNPSIDVIVYPTQVQGEAAPEQIAAALRKASDRAEVDAVILCRGGGSIEDLWAFNDERVARAIRACALPVISGVGHETDFTIADFAADQRAPTPTAAAEMLSPPREALLRRVAELTQALGRCALRHIEKRMQHVDHLSRRLVSPSQRLAQQSTHLQQLRGRLSRAAQHALQQRQWTVRELARRSCRALPNIEAQHGRLDGLMRRLSGASAMRLHAREVRVEAAMRALAHLDPQSVLQRGYSLVRDATGAIVRDAGTLRKGDALHIRFAQGEASARVEDSLD